MSLIFECGIVLLLILLNAFFAMSELAIVSARRPRLQKLSERGHRGAAMALRLHEDPGQFLSAVQIGITLIGILAGAYSGATIAEQVAARLAASGTPQHVAEPLAIGLVVLVLTCLSLVVGELVPKRLHWNIPMRLRVASPRRSS